ncbi:hypothetical protein LOE09_08905 [Pseudosulfitobacter pseudonitzschiae]|nr:hypothetical protein [Pseudosulfitobacter pseudonitzschiae]UFE28286.1 hypothetical protein LOE41_16835 [Pseudosulfitobacter pseudonitzschiae]UFE36755.1 hypothetical protein LOE39_12700 [Pseudosulfitobacter pseudonitzschiae]UFE45563.1 hypothetical protein LOE37_10405 [Pseudosulfitobacter pseudonitzschiae]UFF14465.1 hypothetical protein LOE16_07100 [Pseudosulfitobacter pseudonitzschiae]UFF41594.1 hypothetical protein LOE11_02015 [Pseudosulfitobacter pseudonitzschiae]
MEIGATVDIADPSCATSVFARLDAAARTSATRAASVAAMPKPDMMFEAVSAACASPIPDAVARSKTAGIAAILSAALKPAIAKNVSPSAACFELNSVVAPSPLATSRIAASSAVVAPEMAPILETLLSNSRITLTAPLRVAKAPKATAIPAIAFAPASAIAFVRSADLLKPSMFGLAATA